MTTTNRIDLAIDALISDNSAEALGHLMLYKLELMVKSPPPKTVREAVREGDLPPMKPLKDKNKAPIDFPCPTCHAKPGKPCVKMSTRGKGDGPLGVPLVAGKRHAARRKAWNVWRGQA